MSNNHNDIDNFIYKICYQPIWNAVSNYVSQHLSLLDLTRSRIKYPDTVHIEDMLLESTRDIQIYEDSLLFDAVLSCTLSVSDTTNDENNTTEIYQWFVASCEALITDRLDSFCVTNVQRYIPGMKQVPVAQSVSKNIVPILYKKDLDEEATTFLKQYCPEALERPMPIPIADIAKAMGLDIVEGNRITDDFSIFGEVYFTSGKAEVFDLFKINKRTIDIRRGTILIDAFTFWERNLGCVKNTIAHEVFHWYKHRMYAAIKHILYGKEFIACRCPSNMVYPDKDNDWTDIQRMEWQANNMAPRILMPVQTFREKVDELYRKHGYHDSIMKQVTLTDIANELARFYGVSKQSVLIRMMETGYKEAASIYNYDGAATYHSYVDRADAFYEYRHNQEFRELVDSGLFRYVSGHFVINDSRYIETTADGSVELTDCAWSHIEECTLQFSWQMLRSKEARDGFPFELFHRENTSRKTSKYDSSKSASAVQMSEDLRRKRAEYETQSAARKLTSINKTCWQVIFEIIKSRGLSKMHFCSLTNLGEEVYRKAEKNINTRPSVRTIVSIARGLDLDIVTTEKLMQLAGHAFNESDEDQALRFCITGFPGQSIEDANEFLESYGYEPLGSKQRL